jgi:hypothetical protein
VHSADNLTTFMCRLSRNLGASISWNPKDLSRPVMGLLYLYLRVYVLKIILFKVINNIIIPFTVTQHYTDEKLFYEFAKTL